MIDISSSGCVGCGACELICPQKCIVLKADTEGFHYPAIDNEKCTNCHRCENVCIVNNEIKPANSAEAYAAYNKNDKQRFNSSSGGVFIEVASNIIMNGGVVFGAAFDTDWNVKHIKCTSFEDISRLQKSKYVQSDTNGIFVQVKNELCKGIPVLFSGTPCQCNALSLFLNESYENLYLMDFICHGVPSPLVWQKYLDSLNNDEIYQIDFRDKSNGWSNYKTTIRGNNYSSSMPYIKNPYMYLFLNDLILRPSCYQCKSKFPNVIADITIGDLWGANKIAPQLNDEKGLSLLIVNTPKGIDVLKWIFNSFVIKRINLQDAINCNEYARESVKMPKARKKVMEEIVQQGTQNFSFLATKYKILSLTYRILPFLK